MDNISSLKVGHLYDAYIVDNFDDMRIFKNVAKEMDIQVPPVIIYSYGNMRYTEAESMADLVGIPDIVCNVFMDQDNYGDGNEVCVYVFGII